MSEIEVKQREKTCNNNYISCCFGKDGKKKKTQMGVVSSTGVDIIPTSNIREAISEDSLKKFNEAKEERREQVYSTTVKSGLNKKKIFTESDKYSKGNKIIEFGYQVPCEREKKSYYEIRESGYRVPCEREKKSYYVSVNDGNVEVTVDKPKVLQCFIVECIYQISCDLIEDLFKKIYKNHVGVFTIFQINNSYDVNIVDFQMNNNMSIFFYSIMNNDEKWYFLDCKECHQLNGKQNLFIINDYKALFFIFLNFLFTMNHNDLLEAANYFFMDISKNVEMYEKFLQKFQVLLYNLKDFYSFMHLMNNIAYCNEGLLKKALNKFLNDYLDLRDCNVRDLFYELVINYFSNTDYNLSNPSIKMIETNLEQHVFTFRSGSNIYYCKYPHFKISFIYGEIYQIDCLMRSDVNIYKKFQIESILFPFCIHTYLNLFRQEYQLKHYNVNVNDDDVSRYDIFDILFFIYNVLNCKVNIIEKFEFIGNLDINKNNNISFCKMISNIYSILCIKKFQISLLTKAVLNSIMESLFGSLGNIDAVDEFRFLHCWISDKYTKSVSSDVSQYDELSRKESMVNLDDLCGCTSKKEEEEIPNQTIQIIKDPSENTKEIEDLSENGKASGIHHLSGKSRKDSSTNSKVGKNTPCKGMKLFSRISQESNSRVHREDIQSTEKKVDLLSNSLMESLLLLSEDKNEGENKSENEGKKNDQILHEFFVKSVDSSEYIREYKDKESSNSSFNDNPINRNQSKDNVVKKMQTQQYNPQNNKAPYYYSKEEYTASTTKGNIKPRWNSSAKVNFQ